MASLRSLGIALLAWYALLPPLVGGQVDPMARLSRWEQLRAFDTAEDCEKMTTSYARQMAAQTDNAVRQAFRQVQYVRCVSASDPRLREEGR